MSDDEIKICGVVMPISEIDGCDESHWQDVLEILTVAIDRSGYKAKLVSHADEVGIIQKRIVENLYNNPIVICDVSGKNPNVMFELGIRLAFDKPTIIVKDDKTSYSFDTGPIEHLDYPRDLRHGEVEKFKKELSKKITSTIDKAAKDPSYSTFLKHFGEFTVPKIDTKEVTGFEFIFEELKSLRVAIEDSKRRMVRPRNALSQPIIRTFEFSLEKMGEYDEETIASEVLDIAGVSTVRFDSKDNENHMQVELRPASNAIRFKERISGLLPQAGEAKLIDKKLV